MDHGEGGCLVEAGCGVADQAGTRNTDGFRLAAKEVNQLGAAVLFVVAVAAAVVAAEEVGV